MASETIWKIQRTLRQNSLVFPSAILLVAGILVVIYHVMFDRSGGDMHSFLIVVLLTMFPLAYLDANISKCAEPLAVFRQCALKVVIMQTSFLVLRALTLALSGHIQDMYGNRVNIASAILSLLVIPLGFYDQLFELPQHTDLVVLIGMAVIGALLTFRASSLIDHTSLITIHAWELSSLTSDYMEVLAFVPAALTVFRLHKKDASLPKVESDEGKRITVAFVVATLGFYFMEDMVTACLTFTDSGFEAMAHLLHFVLLLDVGVFLVAIAYDPEHSSRGTMLNRFGDSLFPDNV